MIAGEVLAREAARSVRERLRADAAAGGRPLSEIVGDSIVHEMRRLASTSPGSAADRAFVRQMARTLGERGEAAAADLVDASTERYAREIAGHFDERIFRAATGVLPLALTALLNGTSPGSALLRVHELPRLSDRLCITGEVRALRRLAARGTIVLAPTHVSNLDSVIVGYALHQLGLPPFAYGAGLNLFHDKVLGFFMRHLGAYTVDRAKTDPLYKHVLKEYATASLERGQHGLFFPGGTRSRSGGLERTLKKGLLGTGVTALRRNRIARRARPQVFVFPCTLTYPLVLEASGLVEAHLAASGESAQLAALRVDDDRVERWLRFLRDVLALDLDVHLRIGAPLDPFGCAVDEDGRSLDPRGRVVDAGGYLAGEDGAEDVEDVARDAELTRHLESKLLAAYRRDTVATDTSVVAHVVFERLRRSLDAPSLRRFLGGVGVWTRVERRLVVRDVAQVLDELRALAGAGRVALASEARDAEAVVSRALATFATYHDPHVLVVDGDDLRVGSPSLLFYYRNRLDEHGLLGAPSLLAGWGGR